MLESLESRSPLRAARFVLIASAVAALVALPAASASAAGEEQISNYTVDIVLKKDSSMHVKETIDYDFGSSTDHHGITREIPVEFTVDSGHYREYPISDIQVTSPTGAPADVEKTSGPHEVLRIGDADKTVSGQQTYVIDYDLAGVVNGFSDHQELYWNAIGDDTLVPVLKASATVEGPAAVQKVACFKGQQGSTDTCDGSIDGSGTASFTASDLAAQQGMTVVVSFPLGTFTSTAPIIKERQTVARAFSAGPAQSVPALAILAVLGGGFAWLVSRRGRDERYLSVIPGLEPGLGQDATTQRVGWRRPPIAVQFQPPKDMRPGQLGTLIDEEANVVDVTASIVDLAVRGWLKIEEVETPGRWKSGDWKLTEVSPAPNEQLRDYETKLLNSIFSGRSEVLLSDLKQHFKKDLESVQSFLYADVTAEGWFRGNPSSVRARWVAYGLVVTVAGGALTWLLTVYLASKFGLVGLAIVLVGLAMLALSGRMPARTAKGTALLAQAEGFRLYLEKAEANQIKFEEGQDIFSRYLPYAIVFGVAERWAGIFAQLAAQGVDLDIPTWYIGSYAYGAAFNYAAFGNSMDSFATTSAGSLAAATPSASGGSGFGGGGFSGGGGGGGGVGSW